MTHDAGERVNAGGAIERAWRGLGPTCAGTFTCVHLRFIFPARREVMRQPLKDRFDSGAGRRHTVEAHVAKALLDLVDTP